MQQIHSLIRESKQNFAKADHLVYMTFKNIREVKLLYSATETLYNALVGAMDAVLLYDRYHKRISNVPQNLSTKLLMFNDYHVRKYDFNPEITILIRGLCKTIKARKNSPIEFSRKGKFIICSHEYKMKVIDEKTIKNHLSLARPFINMCETHINGRRR